MKAVPECLAARRKTSDKCCASVVDGARDEAAVYAERERRRVDGLIRRADGRALGDFTDLARR